MLRRAFVSPLAGGDDGGALADVILGKEEAPVYHMTSKLHPLANRAVIRFCILLQRYVYGFQEERRLRGLGRIQTFTDDPLFHDLKWNQDDANMVDASLPEEG